MRPRRLPVSIVWELHHKGYRYEVLTVEHDMETTKRTYVWDLVLSVGKRGKDEYLVTAQAPEDKVTYEKTYPGNQLLMVREPRDGAQYDTPQFDDAISRIDWMIETEHMSAEDKARAALLEVRDLVAYIKAAES